MPITIKKINNEKVNPIILKQDGKGKKKIKGAELVPEIYANILLLGKKKSGKTSVIFKILQACTGKKTQIIIFASTVFNDANWEAILKYFEDKEISITPFQSLYTDDGKNILDEIVKSLQEKSKDEYEKNKQGSGKPSKIINVDSEEDDQHGEGEPKEKTLSAEYIFVFDDLSNELKDSSLVALMKKNRHFKSKVLLSTQYYTDIPKQARQQLELLLLFPQIPEMNINQLWKDTGISIPQETFYKLYLLATKDLYNFLYVDTKKDELRHNFDEKYNIT